jgi:hypothetical protein
MSADTTGMPKYAAEMSPADLVRSYLEIYDSYHRQKETMTYAAATLYLTGAAVLVIQEEPFWLGFS